MLAVVVSAATSTREISLKTGSEAGLKHLPEPTLVILPDDLRPSTALTAYRMGSMAKAEEVLDRNTTIRTERV